MPGFDDEGPALDDWEGGEDPTRPVTLIDQKRFQETVLLNYQSFTQMVLDTMKKRDAEQVDELSRIFETIDDSLKRLTVENTNLSEEVVRLKEQLKRTQLAVGYMAAQMERIMEKLNTL